ncbi:outer membrane lipoprotein-sorting protein [Pseudomonas sp. J452]|uniref:outer membrane lipoprotein-sorting protein n=1 Tax=Pseudomonas sp. J452 TaxID=2898441 RepID=UPI0021ADBD01|nr:outer membrane lipoprotein-sorting protein [Pseudomonas sp. J452]UUY08371.1 outer membrane lipoprotein-sorting protein [Pseudomonas sp. J452]
MTAWAGSTEDQGLEIARQADRHDSGWVGLTADMTMTLRNKQGEESIRVLRIKSLEVENDGNKNLVAFDQPKDVRGTALLTHSHTVEADDQWLYLPALKRVKRIASQNKSGPFMGSEFAFEDFSSQEVEKYRYAYVTEEACPTVADETCFVIERYPVDSYSGYTKQVVWLDQREYRIYKVDYYDRKNSLLKTLSNTGYMQYNEHYWRPTQSLMENHQTDKSTLLEWRNIRFTTQISQSEFTQSSLERAR